ncbi:MAG TPA: C-GCAxxG-C-C family protein [Thermoguttaceae bacterium]|nr:C-GCAxxG-C-C family protein [Thermoguttaceae bacterium]
MGTVCGVVSGGAMLISLFVGEKDPTVRDSLIRELAFWYENAELPIFRPEKPEWAETVETCRADSMLCHISAFRWTQASGRDAYTQEKKERCRRLSCDGAMKTVEILNRHFAGQPCPGQIPPETQTCLECHGKKQLRDIRGAMRCSTCHSQLSEKHPKFEPAPIPKPTNQ